MKLVKCFWRTDRVCPHPALCHYGYECVARPKAGRAAWSDADDAVEARARREAEEKPYRRDKE